MVLNLDNISSFNEKSLNEAVCLLQQERLVAFPTETVYGLGADAYSDFAVASIFETKGRPQFNPLIAHIAEIAWIETFAIFSQTAKILAEAFFPAPLTLVMKRRTDAKLSHLVSAGLDSVAIRMPCHKQAQQLLKAFGRPIAAPSANLSGSVSPTTAQHVFESLGKRVPLILDGGACDVGLESTIVDVSYDKPALLRAGGLSVEEIENVLKQTLLTPEINQNAPRSPGQLLSHYAPSLPVRLNVLEPKEHEAFLGFGEVENATLNLSPKGDVKEAAMNLFAYMRLLDTKDYTALAVSPIPSYGLGLAINDRLKRAAYQNE